MSTKRATRSQTEEFLRTLDPRLMMIYKAADELASETEDTLSDEFQLSAGVTNLFSEYFATRNPG
jgi:hypothetical protein